MGLVGGARVAGVTEGGRGTRVVVSRWVLVLVQLQSLLWFYEPHMHKEFVE